MKRRQKLILVLYAISVVFFGYIYVPYIEQYSNCIHSFAGHHLRPAFTNLIGISPWSRGIRSMIDSQMIFAEICILTAVAVAAILFFNDRQKTIQRMEGPF